LRDRLNIKRGDRVAVLAMNTTDTLEVQFACGRIGAVFLPLNTRLTVPELQYIVGDAAPSLIVHDTELAEAAVSLATLRKINSLLLLGPGGSYEAAIANSKPREGDGDAARDAVRPQAARGRGSDGIDAPQPSEALLTRQVRRNTMDDTAPAGGRLPVVSCVNDWT